MEELSTIREILPRWQRKRAGCIHSMAKRVTVRPVVVLAAVHQLVQVRVLAPVMVNVMLDVPVVVGLIAQAAARAVALQLALVAVTLGVIQAVRLRAPKVVPTTAQAVVTMVAIIPVHLNAAETVGRAVALTARGHVRAIVPITVRPTALMTAQDDVKKSVRRLVQMIV